jgi:diguanylate cyclase (GGDEF)-like protein
MIVRGTAQKAGKVLVINSDPEIIRILEVNLAHANLEVVSAQSGFEALSKLHNDESDIIILDTALHDIGHYEMRRRIREASPASRVPVIIIGTRPQNNNEISKTEDNIIHCIIKPFEPKEVVALVQGYLMHKERMVNTNPMTGLPNRNQVSKEISRLIQQKTTIATIYIAMHDLTAINKVYGYAQGDSIIRLLADIVSEAVHLFGNPTDIAGHFGGDKFLVITSPWKARTLCRRIIADYNRRIKFLYSDEHSQTGYAAYKISPDGKEQTPNMSIHIAVVTNQKRTFHHPLEVIEAASEQIEYLRQSSESNCYFDLKANGIEPSFTSARREIAQSYKEGLKAMQVVLAWFDFLTRELDTPMNEMKECLRSLKSNNVESLSEEQHNNIKALQDNYSHMTRIVEGVAGLARSEDPRADVSCDEVDISIVLGWVLKQVEELAQKRGIKTDIEVVGEIDRIVRDKKSLTQSLLYIIRSEIQSSPFESRLHIRLFEKNEESICIKISNPTHYSSTRALNSLLQRQSNTSPETSINELYPAKILVRGMGGELEATSEKGRGTTYIVTIPKKWRSWIQVVDTLQLAMEISRKEAREALKNTQQTISSLVKQVPSEIKDNFDRLSSKVQELAVLCNRSLFLADDYNTRLEIQQDRLLRQETEQSATSEAILIICRDMASSMQAKHLFNPESTKRVVDCSLEIAKEFRISESDRQALYHAALFKDLAMAFTRHDSDERMEAARERLNLVWRALSTIPCFSAACNLILYRWESYDGTGGSFGIKGADIPLGSRILAVADTYNLLTSDQSPQGKLTPERAMQKIVENSGHCFDPHVVSAFLVLWKRKEMELVLAEN